MQDRKLVELRQVPMFGNLRDDDLQEIARLADEVEVPAGEVLFREGQAADEFVVIIDGQVRLTSDGKPGTTLGRGDFLGEISLVLGRPRAATATCATSCSLFVFALREFNTLMEDVPTVQVEILETLAHRLA